MKKFLLAILSIFYLMISIGFISHHMYCQDRLMKTAMVINDSSCDECPNCTHEKCKKDGNCCKHSTKFVQLKADQHYSSHHTNLTPQQFAILDIFLSGYILPDAYAVKKEIYPVTDILLNGRQNPIHILNCTFLI